MNTATLLFIALALGADSDSDARAALALAAAAQKQPAQVAPVKPAPRNEKIARQAFEQGIPVVVLVGEDREVINAIKLRDDEHPWGPGVHIADPTEDGFLIYRNEWMEKAVSRPAIPFVPAGKRTAQREAAADEGDSLSPWLAPKNVRFYNLHPMYQNMYTMNNGNSRFADPTTIHDSRGPEHHPFIVSGGMAGLTGWKSNKGLSIPDGAKIEVWKEATDVRAYSDVPRWRWRFPTGTVSYDVLSTDKGVFEVRTQTRDEDGWQTKITFKDEAARPEGYNGLQQSCASCHSHTGEIVSVPGRIYQRERWGSDGRFSFRPYLENGELDTSWPLAVR